MCWRSVRCANGTQTLCARGANEAERQIEVDLLTYQVVEGKPLEKILIKVNTVLGFHVTKGCSLGQEDSLERVAPRRGSSLVLLLDSLVTRPLLPAQVSPVYPARRAIPPSSECPRGLTSGDSSRSHLVGGPPQRDLSILPEADRPLVLGSDPIWVTTRLASISFSEALGRPLAAVR